MPSGDTRTAEALQPRSALAPWGKPRPVGPARSTYAGKRSTRLSWRATQSPTRSPQCGSTAGTACGGGSGMTWMRPASLRIDESPRSSPGSLNRRGRTPGGRASPGRGWGGGGGRGGGGGVGALARGPPARPRALADARRHHLALHGERGELGVYQLLFVVAEIDGAQGQQRHRDDVQQQDAAGERRVAPGRAAPAAQQRGRLGRG